MDRAAILWALVMIIGLLLGLVILVTALGVSRHLRRSRPSSSAKRRSARQRRDDEDADEPSGWRRSADDDGEN